MKIPKAVSASSFLDDMFESAADKKRLAQHLQARKIVSKLAALRVAKGLTQSDMASAMGCQQARVSKLESGIDADLKLSDMEAYAKAIGSDLTILVSDRGKSLADQIKAHSLSIRNAFLKLVDFVHKDDLIARRIAEFQLQSLQNLNRFLSETAEKLPVCPDNDTPSVEIIVACDDLDVTKNDVVPAARKRAPRKAKRAEESTSV